MFITIKYSFSLLAVLQITFCVPSQANPSIWPFVKKYIHMQRLVCALSSANKLIFMNKKKEGSEAHSKNDIFKLDILTEASIGVLFFVLEK